MKLIDADSIKFTEYVNGDITVSKDEIQNMPTAFDLESVIKEIHRNYNITNWGKPYGITLEKAEEILKFAVGATNGETDTEGMEGLKKCPFCGGKAEIKEIKGFNREVIAVCVFCQDCGASTRSYTTVNIAAEAWNRRKK